MGSGEGYTLPTPATLRSNDYQFQVVRPDGAWKWTTRVDLSLAVATTQIRDVITPYGLLRDMVPLPGEVVQAMADSIAQVLTAFPPSILLNPISLEFVVDEGRGFSSPKSVQVTNTGLLGSLLAATITSSAAYCVPTPANVNGLSSGASGTFNVSVDSTALLAVDSPYAVSLTVQGPGATNSPQVLPINIIVRPKATITVAPANLTFNVTAPLDGAFPPIPSQQILLTNSGPATSVLDYQIRKLTGVPWLVSFGPTFGSINGGGGQAITVVVAPTTGMGTGIYTETLRFSGYSSNMTADVTVTLNIT